MLTPEQYTFKPHIDNEVKCHHFSTLELLHKGTKSTATQEETSTKNPQVGKVKPLVRRNILASPQPVVNNIIPPESKQELRSQSTERFKSLCSLDFDATEKCNTGEVDSVSKNTSNDVITTSNLPSNRTAKCVSPFKNNNTPSWEGLAKKDILVNEPASASTSLAGKKRVSNTSPLGDSAARVRVYHKRLKKMNRSKTTHECSQSNSLDSVSEEQTRTESFISIIKEESITANSEQENPQVNTTDSRKVRFKGL